MTKSYQAIAILILIGATAYLYSINQNSSELLEYESWKLTYAINFQHSFEDSYRQIIFSDNLKKINLHNSDVKRTYDMGVNRFTALTQGEFEEIYLGKVVMPKQKVIKDIPEDKLIGDIDWAAEGAVTPVKDQSQCGACWAFAAVGALQSLNKITYGSLQRFSQQQLIDCSSKYGNYGCSGGWMTNSFNFVKDNGITPEDEYPYKGVNQKCAKSGGNFKISRFLQITNCNDLANALLERPISVAVDATQWSSYKSGIFSNCGTNLNFAAVLVGATGQYWKLKNCWATSWGENGYIRLARGNTCGICNLASYPLK